MADLGLRPVLLSASFPSGRRGERFAPYDADAVADAVTALVAAVFAANGRIVFGGHPTITPLVLRMAADHAARDAVSVYQSEEFRDLITEPTRELERLGFGTIVPTPRGRDLSESLALMRHMMVERNTDMVGALFVGGMEGIADEYAIVGELRPTLARLPLTAPGGAAARLDPIGGTYRTLPPDLADWLRSPRYPLTAARIVRFLSEI
ncbi:SLOG domain-containing protein [Blastococcus sp. SYSU DS0541]